MTSIASPSRRERMRALTLAEIREHGYAQIAAGGPAALSLNGIAKAMGMSGPAMYRYFSSRDELLATLVTESYEDLAARLTDAAQAGRRRTPEGRLRAVLSAFRDWALAAPHRYRLVFGSSSGSGDLDPERINSAAHRAMSVILASFAELPPAARLADRAAAPDEILERELTAWGAARSTDEPSDPAVLMLGLTAWTRLHGVVSLEIEGLFSEMKVDPARLYDAEVAHLIGARAGDSRAR